MIPPIMPLIITRTVEKQANSNMILQQVYWAVSQTSSLWQKNAPSRIHIFEEYWGDLEKKVLLDRAI